MKRGGIQGCILPYYFSFEVPTFYTFFFSTQAYVSGGDDSMLMFQDFHYANTLSYQLEFGKIILSNVKLYSHLGV